MKFVNVEIVSIEKEEHVSRLWLKLLICFQ
jgi:hypothetical protein